MSESDGYSGLAAIADAITDVASTEGPDYNGNVAEALFCIAAALNRIADSLKTIQTQI